MDPLKYPADTPPKLAHSQEKRSHQRRGSRISPKTRTSHLNFYKNSSRKLHESFYMSGNDCHIEGHFKINCHIDKYYLDKINFLVKKSFDFIALPPLYPPPPLPPPFPFPAPLPFEGLQSIQFFHSSMSRSTLSKTVQYAPYCQEENHIPITACSQGL